MRAIDGGDVKFGAAYVDDAEDFRDEPTDPSPFIPGYDAQFQSLSANNSGQRVIMPFSRRSVDIEAGAFQGSWGWQFTLTRADEWLKAVLGEPTDGKWDGEPHPMFFYIDYGRRSSKNNMVIEGAVAQSASVSPQVGSPKTTVTVEGFFSDRYEYDGGSWPLGEQPQPSKEDILRYHDAELKLDDETRAIVQNAQLDMQWPNLQPIQGFAGRGPIGYEVNGFEPSLSYTAAEVGEPEEDLLYGGSDTMAGEVPRHDGQLEMTRDGSGFRFGLEGGFPQSYQESGLGEVGSRLDESMNFDVNDIVVEAI